MWSEPFSVDNLRRILDFENRKGNFLEREFFQDAYKETEAIRECINQLTAKGISDIERSALNEKKERHIEKKRKFITEQLERISGELTNPKYKIEMSATSIKSADAFVTLRNATNFFALRQLQYAFQKYYKVKQASSYAIVSQVTRLLEDGFPKVIIRTDINRFYESIPHDGLLRKIEKDNLLDVHSKRILHGIFHEYRRLSNAKIGLPRGMGVSAYMSELYMRDFDEGVRRIPDLVYYARYVDDIVAVFVPVSTVESKNYLVEIDKLLESKMLERNNHKTQEVNLLARTIHFRLEYLGYLIEFDVNQTKIRLSSKKVDKLKCRVNLALDAYDKESKFDIRGSRRILLKRIRFLTGNTRLVNNKKDILVGIFFSNSLVTYTSDIEELDRHLKSQIRSRINDSRLRERLAPYSFLDGFENKRFSPFKTHELARIIAPWKNL